jgi:hypothetical protein
MEDADHREVHSSGSSTNFFVNLVQRAVSEKISGKISFDFAYTSENRVGFAVARRLRPDRCLIMLTDSTTGVFRSDPDRLEQLFVLALEHHPDYRPEELGSILEHQLCTLVEFDLSSLDAGSQRLLQAAAACGEGGGIRTFRDLFTHHNPPIHLLQLTKNFAKSHLKHPDSPLPPEIATVLYYTSIVTAWVRLNRRISELAAADLERGLAQVAAEPWLDEELRNLLVEGLGRAKDFATA